MKFLLSLVDATKSTEKPTEKKDEDEEIANAGDDQALDTDASNVDVKVLTEADLNNYTIYDIVLPLPGRISVFPQNDVGEFYK